jgi:hypothetical protein
VIAMSDLAIAGVLMAVLIALAISAPIWGADSRDGVESDQPSRRIAWLHDRPAGQSVGPARAVSVALADVLRTVAYRLDETAPRPAQHERPLAEAC